MKAQQTAQQFLLDCEKNNYIYHNYVEGYGCQAINNEGFYKAYNGYGVLICDWCERINGINQPSKISYVLEKKNFFKICNYAGDIVCDFRDGITTAHLQDFMYHSNPDKIMCYLSEDSTDFKKYVEENKI